MPIMSSHSNETKIKLKELLSTTNKHLKKLVQNIESTELDDFIKETLLLEKINNRELTKLFDILCDYYSNCNVEIKTALAIVDFKFLKGSKDIEIAIFSYFKLLSIIRKNVLDNDVINGEIFKKCCLVIENKITFNFILKEVYYLLRCIMREDKVYLIYFITEKYYRNFVFFNMFINDFYKCFDDMQTVELYDIICEQYQAELFLRFKEFNPYLLLLKQTNLMPSKVPLYYLTYDCNILYENIANEMVISNYHRFLAEINKFIKTKDIETTVENCSFKHLHDKIEERVKYKNVISTYLDNFYEDITFKKLLSLFHNPFYFLKFSKRTNFKKLGEFVSKEKNTHHLRSFVETFDFKGMNLVPAIREFLSSFILPTESQMIIRLLEEFSKKYYNDQNMSFCLNNKKDDEQFIDVKLNRMIDNMEIDNEKEDKTDLEIDEVDKPKSIIIDLDPTKYTEKDIYIIVYSLLLLNTDLYSNTMKSKMNRKLYVENLRKCKLSGEFSDSYLESLYYEIKFQKLEYILSNKTSISNYKILKKVEQSVKDDNIMSFFTESKFSRPLPEIESHICSNCKEHVYDKMLQVHSSEILKIISTSRNDLEGNSNSFLEMFISLIRYFNLYDLKIEICYLLTEFFNENYFEMFFELFHEILESKNNDELHRIERETSGGNKTYFYELPFVIINKQVMVDKSEKIFLFKKDKKVDNDYIKTVEKFVRNISSVKNDKFEQIVSQNLKTDYDYSKEILFQIIHKNCFRINLIIDKDLIDFLEFKRVFIKDLIGKIIELDLKEEFYNLIMLYDLKNSGCDDIFLKITKDNPTFLDSRLFMIYKNTLRTESEKAFAVLLHLSRYTSVFDIVCGDFVNNYISLTNSVENVDIEDIRENNLELFVKHLTVSSKLISFYMSSNECVNYVIMARYTCKKNNSDKIQCPLKNQYFIDKINKQITYILLKDHLLDDYDLHQYTFYTIQILSRAIPSFIEYLLSNVFIFRYINGFTLKTIIKIIFTCVKRYKDSSLNVCVCEDEHNIDDKIERLLDFLNKNNYLSEKQICTWKDMQHDIKIKDDSDNKDNGNKKNVFEL